MTAKNQIAFPLSTEESLNLLKRSIALMLNCHHVGTIQDFNAEKQTATVTVNYQRTLFQQGEAVLVDYPPILDCPVFFLFGGNGGFTVPILEGDECLIAFNDRDFNNWFAGQTRGPAASPRTHAYSDAVAFVGIRSLAHSILNFDTQRPTLRSLDGQTKVAVSSKVEVSNATRNLKVLLQDLASKVKDLATAAAAITVPVTTAPGVSGIPVNAGTITTIASDLITISTEIGELLE